MAFLEQVREGQQASTRRSRRWSPPTRASRCRASTSARAAPRDVGPAAQGRTRGVNFIVYHSGYDIGDTQKALPRRRQGATRTRNTVDALIKSLRENNWDATAVRKKGKKFGNVPNVYAELGSVWRSVMDDPDQCRAPARQADQPRRPEAHRLGHRQPLVRLAAGGDRRPAPLRVHRRGQGALRPAVRARGRRRGPDAQGADARSARSATGSSAATPPRAYKIDPDKRGATRSTATQVKALRDDGYLARAGHRARVGAARVQRGPRRRARGARC